MTTTLAQATFVGGGSSNLKDYVTQLGYGKFSLGGLATGLHVDVTGGVAVVNTSAGFTDGAWCDTDVARDFFEMYADMMRANDTTTTQFQAIVCRSNGNSGATEDHVDIQWQRINDSTVELHIKRINQNSAVQDATVNASFAWAKGAWMRLGCFVAGSTVWLFTEPQGGGARTVHGSLVLSGTGGDFNDTSHQRFGIRCIEKPHQWDNFTVTKLPLTFTTQPTETVKGEVIASPVVKLTDTTGATVVTPFTGDITVAIGTNPGSGTLSGTTTRTAVSGAATFSGLSINNAGSGYTLTATATGVDVGTSATFDITTPVLVFTTQPGETIRGATMATVRVSIEDIHGTVLTDHTDSITVAIGTNPGPGTLSGTKTVAAISGVATFSTLSIDVVGSGYTLTAAASGLTGGTSAGFDITPLGLVFLNQPTTTVVNARIAPALQVAIEDIHGNIQTGLTDAITIAIASGPGGATLRGTKTRNAVAGVATFDDLTIDEVD